MPQRNALHHRNDLRAHDPRQSADALAQDRVALVWHRARALLAGAERLLQLAHLGSLAVPHFERDGLAHGGEHCERRNPFTDAVADHNLRCDIGSSQPECSCDVLLDLRVDVAVGADCARDLGDADRLFRAAQPVTRPCRSEREVGDAVSPHVRLGVDTVSAPHP